MKCKFNNCDFKTICVVELIKHCKIHFINNEIVICPIENCSVDFSNENSLKSHIRRIHREISGLENKRRKLENQNERVVDSDKFSDPNDGIVLDDSGRLTQSLGAFFLKLRSEHNLSDNVLNFVSDELSSINPKFYDKKLAGSYEHFNTKYKREKYFELNNQIVEPVEIYLGTDNLHKKCFYHYVPILNIIKFMYNGNNLSAQTDEPKDSILRDFKDGISYKNNIFLNSNGSKIEILLYQDAFEVSNPLGSAKKKYKLLGVYMTFGNLPPYMRCQLNNITMQTNTYRLFQNE